MTRDISDKSLALERPKLLLDSKKIQLAIMLIKKNLRSDGSVTNPVSLVQRHLRLGYSEAMSIVNYIEEVSVFCRFESEKK